MREMHPMLKLMIVAAATVLATATGLDYNDQLILTVPFVSDHVGLFFGAALVTMFGLAYLENKDPGLMAGFVVATAIAATMALVYWTEFNLGSITNEVAWTVAVAATGAAIVLGFFLLVRGRQSSTA